MHFQSSLARRGSSVVAYALALALSAAMIGMHVALWGRIEHRPILLQFILPTLLGAYLGGLGPGPRW